jgi:MFS family permease
MHGASEPEGDGANPAGAVRMAVIAFLSFNLSMGCMFGPFGVFVAPIEHRLGVTREISTLAVPVVTFAISFLAPVVGGIASRISLRWLMIAGSLLMTAGFATLAVAHSVVVFIGAYALLVGPGLSVCGVVAPSTLVTRWFQVRRGRALGFATTPALMAATPLLATFVLNQLGLTAAYGLLSGLMLICLAASLLAIDHPTHDRVLQTAGANAGPAEPKGEQPQPGLVRDSGFWRLALAAGLYNAVIVMFSTELVPYAIGLGINPTRAAVLLTAYLVGTLIGTPFVGWLADKVGGARMIGSLCLSLALWQACLLIQPTYALIALLALLAGLQGSAMISCLGLALSEQLGQAGFAKAWGASTLVGLPFAVLSVPVASGVFVQTGSYRLVFILAAAVLAVGAALALSIGRRNPLFSTAV